jgi:hypothetical protein
VFALESPAHSGHEILMPPTDGQDVARLLKEAASSMKNDVKGAVAKLETAYALAQATGAPDEASVVAEELSRGWSRRKSAARSLFYAIKATKLTPARKAAWNTLAQTCELLAARTRDSKKQGRARALYRGAAAAFKQAASLAKDREDKQWLLELASDASRQGKAPAPA